jgi:hypothetical protein
LSDSIDIYEQPSSNKQLFFYFNVCDNNPLLWLIERVSCLGVGGISKGESDFHFLLKLVPLEATGRVRFARNMDHVVKHLVGEMAIVYIFSTHHLNLACTSSFKLALILHSIS